MDYKDFYKHKSNVLPTNIKYECDLPQDYFEKMYNSVVYNQKYVSKEFIMPQTTLLPDIKNVIFNNPVTVILWNDGTKTVVKAQNEPFDPEKGFAMAITKKAFGNRGKYFDTVKKWLK